MGKGVKVMPESILVTPNTGSYSKRKERNIGSQMGQVVKTILTVSFI